jgi:hypothetical protein
MRPNWSFLVILVVVLALARGPTTAAPAVPVDQFTPVLQSVLSTPRWFNGTDGNTHLVYELQLVNAFPVAVTVTTVEVREPQTDRVIAALSGDALAAAMSLMASGSTPATTLPASTIGVIWFDIALEAPPAVPAQIEHRLTVDVAPGLPVPATIISTGAQTDIDRRPPVVVGPPLRGPGWIAVGSCCDGPHRRALQPVNGRLRLAQRFAIDWNGLDADGFVAVGDLDVNESWVFYGAPVIAVADATVVAAVDQFPDQIPNHPEPVDIEEADGNYVVLNLGDGRYAFYAHLKPGSVRVRAGDQVCRGQVLGRLGNSGSSSGPHLHFHVSDGISALDADGMPYVIDRFSFTGRIPPLDVALPIVEAGQPLPIDPTGAGSRHRVLPLGRDVVRFPGASRGGGGSTKLGEVRIPRQTCH